jgi:hypothetical protein
LRPDAAQLFFSLVDLGHVGARLESVLLHQVLLVVRESIYLFLHFLNLSPLLLGEPHLLCQRLLPSINLRILIIHFCPQIVVFLSGTSQLNLYITQTLLQLFYFGLRDLHRLTGLVLLGLSGAQ